MTVVGFLSLELHFPSARSLKDKRSVLRSVKDRLRKHNVSVAEVDHQDLWQRCELAMVVVGSDVRRAISPHDRGRGRAKRARYYRRNGAHVAHMSVGPKRR